MTLKGRYSWNYQKQIEAEGEVREHIHSVGYKTFPRPKEALKNFRVMVTDKGAGMNYVHPDHGHTSIRVMPGKPHSPHPHQRFPYVIHKVDGKFFDKFGKVVLENSPEAHIPLENFLRN